MTHINLFLILPLLLLTACGPSVETISAPKNIKLKEQSLFALKAKNEISESFRDITFIIKPNTDELTNYELDFSKLNENKSSCDLTLLNRLPSFAELPALALIGERLYSFKELDKKIDMLLLDQAEEVNLLVKGLDFQKTKMTYLENDKCTMIEQLGGHKHERSFGSWSKTFLNNTSYSNKIPKKISRTLDNESKLEAITYLIYAAGDIKTLKNEEKLRVERSDLNPKKKIDTLKVNRKGIFTQFPCYKTKMKQAETGKKKVKTCLLNRPDNNRKYKIEGTRSCQKFSKRISSTGKYYRYYDLSPEELNLYEAAIVACKNIEAQMETIEIELTKKYKEIHGPLQATYESASKVVTDILELLKTEDGIDYAIGKDNGASLLSVDTNLTKVNDMVLVLSSFTNLVPGDVEYSLENGKLSNAYFSKRFGVKMLNFTITEEDVVAVASLSFSEHPTLGAMFTGDVNLSYTNGIKRKGIMKLELNYKFQD